MADLEGAADWVIEQVNDLLGRDPEDLWDDPKAVDREPTADEPVVPSAQDGPATTTVDPVSPHGEAAPEPHAEPTMAPNVVETTVEAIPVEVPDLPEPTDTEMAPDVVQATVEAVPVEVQQPTDLTEAASPAPPVQPLPEPPVAEPQVIEPVGVGDHDPSLDDVTTAAIGEEGDDEHPIEPEDHTGTNPPDGGTVPEDDLTTAAIGEEGDDEEPTEDLTTTAVGEDGDDNTTAAIGEEGDDEEPIEDLTTTAVGEDGDDGGLPIDLGGPVEIDPEDLASTMAVGEEGDDPFDEFPGIGPIADVPVEHLDITTQMAGEEGDDTPDLDDTLPGEGDPIADVPVEHLDITTQMAGEEGDDTPDLDDTLPGEGDGPGADVFPDGTIVDETTEGVPADVPELIEPAADIVPDEMAIEPAPAPPEPESLDPTE
ncbi:MAG: hypothetical protein AAGD18_01605 [Actinomycetota bacterium]